MSAPSTRLLVLLAVSVWSLGCVEHSLVEAIRPREISPLPQVDPGPPTAGAIWPGVAQSGSFLAYDRKARGVGDLVTVVILEDLAAQGSANTTVENGGSFSASLNSDVGFTDLLRQGARVILGILGVGNAGGSGPPGQSVNVIDASRSNQFEGDGETNRESSFRGTVTCQVVGIRPSGVFEIYGRREILVNHELQVVTVEGLVRRQDIGLDNQIPSSQLADARLTFDGIGVIDDKQRPSLLARVMDWVYPF